MDKKPLPREHALLDTAIKAAQGLGIALKIVEREPQLGPTGADALVRLTHGGHEVRLWTHDADAAIQLQRDGENVRYLPGISLRNIGVSADLRRALSAALSGRDPARCTDCRG